MLVTNALKAEFVSAVSDAALTQPVQTLLAYGCATTTGTTSGTASSTNDLCRILGMQIN